MKLRTSMVISVGLVSVSLVLSAFFYAQLPEEMAVYWNIHGVAEKYAPKNIAAFIFPALILVSIAWKEIVGRAAPRQENLSRSVSATDAVLVAGALVLTVFHGLMLATAMQVAVDMPRVMTGCIGFIVAVTGNVLGKTRSNHVVGIRTRWTLASERVWDGTHRVGGRILFAEGLGLVLLAALMPSGYLPVEIPMLVVAAIVLLTTALGLIGYSRKLAELEAARKY